MEGFFGCDYVRKIGAMNHEQFTWRKLEDD